MDLDGPVSGELALREVRYHLYVREKVLRGMQAAEDGRVISQDEAEDRVAGWLASLRDDPE